VACIVARAAARNAFLGRAWHPDFPGRQPAYEDVRFLGMADRRGAQARAARDFPVRGLHAAQADAVPRKGGLHEVVHVFHLPGHIKELVARVNEIRRRQHALHYDWTLRFHATDNPEIIAYSKTSPDGSSHVLVVVNLDPHHMQHGWVQAPPDWLRTVETGPDR